MLCTSLLTRNHEPSTTLHDAARPQVGPSLNSDLMGLSLLS